ncbi:hypothetical protein V866_004538 [Kwoniella sp. B9012]
MMKSSVLILTGLIASVPFSIAQNNAWIGCYAIPSEPISGISISSPNTWHPAGCAAECQTLPGAGFSPVTYSFYSPTIEIGEPISTHCLCTNYQPDNEGFEGPSDPEDCRNDDNYSAWLVDTSLKFQGCWATYDPSIVVHGALVDTFQQCIQACSSYRWIAINHSPTGGQLRCQCSPFSFHGSGDAIECDDTSSDYLFYTNDVSVQPSARAGKRRQGQ